MSYARPDLMSFVLVIPLVLAAAIWLYARRRRRIASGFSDPHLLARLGGAQLNEFPLLRLWIMVLAGLALGYAITGPRWGVRTSEGQSLSMNVVIATDISRSMLTPDIEPSRLERARLFARRMLRELPGDRFGLVVFSGRAYVLSPLTVDHSALALYLDALDPNMVSQGGSSLAAAIVQATDLVRGSNDAGGDRAVVLLSDGEALEEIDGVMSAADRAARASVRVITVGIGTTAGDRIPEVDAATGEVIGYKRDEAGEIVISRLDEGLLRDVAARTGGSYIQIEDPAALERVVSDMRGMQRVQGENTMRVEARDRFATFAAIALLLLALDMILFGPDIRRFRGSTPNAATLAPVAPVGGRKARVAHVAILVMLLVGNGFGPGDLEKGNRLYRAGKYDEAAAVYQRIVDSGDATPQVHYNLGTALLALGRYEDAERQFGIALDDVDPELRQRTFYNMGNRFLNDGRAQEEVKQQGALYDAAIDSYRRALRIDPQDTDAKWNLELALREREENQQQQQQAQQSQSDEGEPDEDDRQQPGGSGSGQPPSATNEQPQGQRAGSGEPMTPEQAERILSAIEQDERDLTRELLRRSQRRVRVLRDW